MPVVDELRRRSYNDRGKGFRWTVTGLFGDSISDRLWTVLGVTPERWDMWQAARGALVVIPELPSLSRLPHIDEGAISFEPVQLEQDSGRVLALVVAGNPSAVGNFRYSEVWDRRCVPVD